MEAGIEHDDAEKAVNTDVSTDADGVSKEPGKEPGKDTGAEPGEHTGEVDRTSGTSAPRGATAPDSGTGKGTGKGAGKGTGKSMRESRRADADAGRPRRASAASTVRRLRTILGQLVWLVCLLAAIVLAVGALLVVVKANPDNALVKAIMRLADVADVGVFDRKNGIKQFGGSDPAIKDALFNWGIGAVVWLVVGRILERIIRPR